MLDQYLKFYCFYILDTNEDIEVKSAKKEERKAAQE